MDYEVNTALAGASLPLEGFVRVAQLVGDSRKGLPPIVPISKSHLLRMVREGKFPKPLKVSPRLAMWPVAAVRQWMSDQNL